MSECLAVALLWLLFKRVSSDLVGCLSFVTLPFCSLTLTVPHRLFLVCTWSENQSPIYTRDAIVTL